MYLSAAKPLVQFQNSAHNSRFHLSLPNLASFFPEMRPCPRIRMVLVPYFDYCTIITQYYYASGAHLAVYLLQCTLPQNSRFGRNNYVRDCCPRAMYGKDCSGGHAIHASHRKLQFENNFCLETIHEFLGIQVKKYEPGGGQVSRLQNEPNIHYLRRIQRIREYVTTPLFSK